MMSAGRRWIYVSLLFVLSLGTIQAIPASPAWQTKVDQAVLRSVAAGDGEFLLYLNQQADLSGAAGLPTRRQKGEYVYQRLTALAARTQPAVTSELRRLGVAYRPFWIANVIWARGSAAALQTLASRADVAHVYANPQVKLQLPAQTSVIPRAASPSGVEASLSLVNAPQLWAAGYSGQGVVIGGADTGYQWDHPAIKNQYRGWNGVSADHNYNWHDAVHLTGQSGWCANQSPVPCDGYSPDHGTHTMGTMVGGAAVGGGGNQIGMAPQARWIGCRNMDRTGFGTPARYIECFQWFLAPTDLNDQNANPDLAPDVINNSWGCSGTEGCNTTNWDVLQPAVDTFRAAGIMSVQSAGNDGFSGCGSINTPAAIYDSSFTVGNTMLNDVISSSSSRGPVDAALGGPLVKPDITAPGTNIYSSVFDPSTSTYGYTMMTGTSMAGPHVAGLVALLISAHPSLSGHVAVIENIIEQGSKHIADSSCGPAGPPNNTYGWGRIDAWGAFNQPLVMLDKRVDRAQINAGDQLTYTLTITNLSTISTTHNLVITDVLPLHTELITATLPFTHSDSLFQWTIASLAPMAHQAITLTVTTSPTATGTIVNQRYGYHSAEFPQGELGQPVTTYIIPPLVMLNKRVDRAQIRAGDQLTYTLTITNLSTISTTHDLVITDVLPLHTDLITATLPFTRSDSLFQWTAASLAPMAHQTITLTVTTAPTATGTIVNQRYGYHSAEFPQGELGFPVTTYLIPPPSSKTEYLPLVLLKY